MMEKLYKIMVREGDTCGNYSMKPMDYIFTDMSEDSINAYCKRAYGELSAFSRYVVLPISYKVLAGVEQNEV